MTSFAITFPKFLRDIIQKFVVEFFGRYRKNIEDETPDLAKLKKATVLIEKYFANLPIRA